MKRREPCKDTEEGCFQHRICKVCRGNQLKAFQGLAGGLCGWDRVQGGGVLEGWKMEAKKLAGPIRKALWARVSSLGFLLSVLGSLWQV